MTHLFSELMRVKIWEMIFILYNKKLSCDTLFLKFYFVNITTKTDDPC